MELLTPPYAVSYVGHMTADAASGVVPTWTLPDKIRKAREHAGLSQQELADQLSVTRASVVNWERGHTKPLRLILSVMADVTGVDLAWLAEGEGGYVDLDATASRSNHGLLHLQHDLDAPVTTQDIVGEFRRSVHGTPKSTARRIEPMRAA